MVQVVVVGSNVGNGGKSESRGGNGGSGGDDGDIVIARDLGGGF